MKPFRSEFIYLRERRHHIRHWGDDTAPMLFLLHGWGDIGASFQFVIDALQGNWRIIAPDWRGFGQTQWNDGPYFFPDYLADLDALLEYFSPQQAAMIAGHSMGGIVASLYAGIRPERVSHLANLEGFMLWVSGPGETPDRFETWLRQIRDNNSSFRHYRFREEFAARMRGDNPRLTPERAAFLAEHSLRATNDGFTFCADPRHRWINPVLYPMDEAKACWQRITARTLLIAGRNSPLMKPFIDKAQSYHERIACFPKAHDAWIDDCGHNIHHDQPDALARLLAPFFSA